MLRIVRYISFYVFTTSAAFAQYTVPARFTEQMLFADDPKEWLTIKKVVPPVYPKELFSRGVTGVVDVSVTIDVVGAVEKLGAIKSNPENPLFEKAARDSIPLWTFRPAINDKCVPEIAEGNVRIWFSITDGKEEVSVSSTPGTLGVTRSKSADAIWQKIINRKEVDSELTYPYSARREFAQAAIWSVMTVNLGTGEVQDVEISHALPDPNVARRLFRPTIVRALKTARFEPNSAETGKTVKVCIPFYFFMTN